MIILRLSGIAKRRFFPLPVLQIRIWDDLQLALPLVPRISDISIPLSNESCLKFKLADFDSSYVAKSNLGEILDNSGSDKNSNLYTSTYEQLLASALGTSATVVEIGIGTNNTNLPSNMGETGIPGASLRAWREFLGNNCKIIGADIDRDILFQESQISTHWVDQIQMTTLFEFAAVIERGGGADLIVDDGLHRPLACINTLLTLLGQLKVGGVYVVEDQVPILDGFWRLCLGLLPPNYYSLIHHPQVDISLIVIQRLK